MHINHRRKNKHRAYRHHSHHPWFDYVRRRQKYDCIGMIVGRGACWVMVFKAPIKRYRAYVNQLLRQERFDDIHDRVPGWWNFDT